MQFTLPWMPVGDRQVALQAELEKEVGPEHPLFGRWLEVLARRIDNDDILVKCDAGKYAVVHLTWSGKREGEKWPFIRDFADWDDWVTRCLRVDQDAHQRLQQSLDFRGES